MDKDILCTRIRNCSVPCTDVNFENIFQGSFNTKLQEYQRLGRAVESVIPVWYIPDDIRSAQSSYRSQLIYHGTDHINVIRRKPVAKDNTGALKLWLLQHKKNPYPNKPEKIMLAILSRMTLTQVSTWFANARRRLKKEFPEEEFDILTDSLQQNNSYTQQ